MKRKSWKTEPAEGRSLDLDALGFELDQEGEAWFERLQEAARPRTPGRIGAYELVDEVSRGGQGVVFRAVQPGTNRVIALKRMLAGSFATPATRLRFEHEIEAVSALNHPGIVTVYGMEVIDGQPVFAMEWIEGVPVSAWARGRDPRAILELFVRIAAAVSHAHGRGVLHRDLKPSNVLVDRDGGPHLLDFGLAKRLFLEGRGEAAASWTSAGFGTPGYSSPEQLDPRLLDGGALDARTDVYSLGVMLYEALCGRHPYGSWQSVGELLEAMRDARVERPSKLDPRLGAELDVVVAKAMAREREERYPDVASLARDLEAHLAGRPVEALPPSSLYLVRKLVARHRAAVVAGLSGLALLFAFSGHALWQAGRLRDALKETEEARDLALDEAHRFASLRAFVPDCTHRAADPRWALLPPKPETVRQSNATAGLSTPAPEGPFRGPLDAAGTTPPRE